MALILRKERCSGCGLCLVSCPFGALTLEGGLPEADAACRLCGLCVKACPQGALLIEEADGNGGDAARWRGLLVVAEQTGGELHPVSLELLGQALRLAAPSGEPVAALLIGSGMEAAAHTLIGHGADRVCVYDDPAYAWFRADAYTPAAVHCIQALRPSVVLAGSTEIGRSLAPRVAARLGTGLTADCTALAYEGGALTQIRPAFGGNIMARIVTPRHRPQMATVRYRVFDRAPPVENLRGKIVPMQVPAAVSSAMEILEVRPRAQAADLCDAQVIVAGGRGVKSPRDMALLAALARALGGEVAVTRPLAEAGYAPQSRQIGLSGRTVKPRLLVACGLSGAIQFQAGMGAAEYIVAINTDPGAPIFEIAHVGIEGDLYEIIPALLAELKGGQPHVHPHE